MIGKHEDAKQFIKELQKEHQQADEKVNRNFVDNEYLNIIDGEPVLKRDLSKKVSQQQENFLNLVASKMPLTDIVSVITDVEIWLGISRYLKPLSGYESKIDDYDLRFVATSFAYGCNIGPVQAERCLKKYSRKQIAWIFNHHITEMRLNKISEVIIRAYKQFELPYIWVMEKALLLMELIGICIPIIYWQSIIFVMGNTVVLAIITFLINMLRYLATLFHVVFMKHFTFSMVFMNVTIAYVQTRSMETHMHKTK